MPPLNRRRRRRNNEADLVGLSEAERAVELAKRRGELSLAEAGIAVRTVNTLENRGLTTINDIMELEASDLLSIPNFGEKTLREILDAVTAQSLTPPRSWLNALPKSKKKPKP